VAEADSRIRLCNPYSSIDFYLSTGNYPRTHSVRRLFRVLIELIRSSDLESAYIATRLLPVEFEKKEVENMLVFAKKLFEKLGG